MVGDLVGVKWKDIKRRKQGQCQVTFSHLQKETQMDKSKMKIIIKKKSWCVTKHCSMAGLPHSLLHLLFTASLTRYKYHCPFYRWRNWGSESEIFSPRGSKHFCKYKKYFGFCRPWLSVRSIQLCPCREKTAVDKSETEEKQAVGWIWSRGLRIPTPLLTQGHILNKEQG